MAGTLVLKCTTPGCPRQRRVKREAYDHPRAAVVATLCDWHDDGGGFPETFYYDTAGKQLLDDPLSPDQPESQP